MAFEEQLIQRALQGAAVQQQAPPNAMPIELVVRMAEVGIITVEQARSWIFKGRTPKFED